MSFAAVQPNSFVALRPPSGLHKVVKVVPHTNISLGKYGSFPANLLLGRPFYLTFEIVDDADGKASVDLRAVPVSELHAEILAENRSSPSESRDEEVDEVLDDPELAAKIEALQSPSRNNRLTVDDPTKQALSTYDIEELKRAGTFTGKDIIAKIMESHSALDEKTSFSLEKYTLRKFKKYMKRFTVLPLDVSMLARWMLLEKEPLKIMELREEMLGLIASWSNVHASGQNSSAEEIGSGRWLVTEDTGGLIVALLAERMGILHPYEQDSRFDEADEEDDSVCIVEGTAEVSNLAQAKQEHNVESRETVKPGRPPNSEKPGGRPPKRRRHGLDAMSAKSNSITLIHPATQPNISLLSYFSYNPTEPQTASPVHSAFHPLHSHLKTLTWLQLIDPHQDSGYAEPEKVPDDVLELWKPGKRSTYYRKRRRWENTRRVVDETRAGGFDGLVVATPMEPISILRRTVPLVKGGGQVVVYSPTVEPLAELVDIYSTSRRTAFINALARDGALDGEYQGNDERHAERLVPSEEFPVDPRLLLAPYLHTVRARDWQVLPGRTHPVMTGKGGAEGYLFTATRVIPLEGKVEAKGRFSKKRKGEQRPVEVTPNEAEKSDRHKATNGDTGDAS